MPAMNRCEYCGHEVKVRPVFRVTTKDGDHFDLREDGGILFDSSRSYKSDGVGWKILGFSTRWNSNAIVTLAAAVDGASIGQGWVHDLDHGCHRLWGHPSDRRAVKVERLVS